MKKNIAIIAAGFSGEAKVSINGAKSVLKNIDTNIYNIYLIYITRKEWYYKAENGQKIQVDKNDFSLMINKKKVKFHCVFNVIHGEPGEDGKLQGYFDLLGIPYTNSNLMTSAITFNKYICGIITQHFGATIPKSILVKCNDKIDTEKIIKELSLPCFVKPNNGGSSIGVAKVKMKSELKGAIEIAFKVDPEVLVEEFIEGTEITCGMIKKNNKIIALPITEVVSKTDFFDYKAKYTKGNSDEITPARIDKKIASECQTISSLLYDKLNCKGMVRMDYIIKKNKLYLLDINTVPGLSSASIIPQQAKVAGITAKQLYHNAIEEALEC